MRVIILAATSQQGALADKLIQDRDLSKIILTVSSQKLTKEAQALIIYFESKRDLVQIESIKSIYDGVPLQIYFGSRSFKDENGKEYMKHFFNYEQVPQMLETLYSQFKEINQAADFIYENLLASENPETEGVVSQDKVTVQSLLAGMNRATVDLLEEQCVEFFYKPEGGHSHKGEKLKVDTEQPLPKDVSIPKKKFRKWWTEGKLTDTEQIKFYVMGKLLKFVKENKDNPDFNQEIPLKLQNFSQYKEKLIQVRETRMMKDHYDNNFKLDILATKSQSEKEKTAKAAKASDDKAAAVKDADAAETTEPTAQQESGSSKPLKSLLSAFSEEIGHNEEVKTFKSSQQKPGTIVKVEMKVFHSETEEQMVYLQNLHQFNDYDAFLSIGFKPKAKDQKTFIEDLRELEYIKDLERESKLSLILEGEKVRIGYQENDIDPWYFMDDSLGPFFQELNQVIVTDSSDSKKSINMNFTISLGKKLMDLLTSPEPLLASIFERLSVDASIKFHQNQFQTVLTNITEKTYTEFVTKTVQQVELQSVENGEEEEQQNEEEASAEKASAEEDQDRDQDQEEENEQENEYGREYGEDGYADQENEDENNEAQDGFNYKDLIAQFLPVMLFKWNATIQMQPDLEDILEICKENRDSSFLMKSFFEFIKESKGVDLKEPQTDQSDVEDNKSKLIQYLRSEVGFEVDIAWKTHFFFLTATIKTDDIGNIINLLNRANLIR